jgi:hypothetical protein
MSTEVSAAVGMRTRIVL